MIRVEKTGDAYLVFGEENAETLYWGEYFGRPLNNSKPKMGDKLSPMRLSKYEVLYLLEQGKITVVKGNKKLNLAKPTGNSLVVYIIYKDLRTKGLIVRSGLKFGATFAVYIKGPGIDHAPFLVQVVPETYRLSGIEVIRAGRLSHGARKRFVFATVTEQRKPIYITLSWVKI
ncbi:MAG TPA: tRNA-intron lyase [bacterium]|nr:tRNA-intron lyase [bacterium]